MRKLRRQSLFDQNVENYKSNGSWSNWLQQLATGYGNRGKAIRSRKICHVSAAAVITAYKVPLLQRLSDFIYSVVLVFVFKSFESP